jgi:hypothetical protein
MFCGIRHFQQFSGPFVGVRNGANPSKYTSTDSERIDCVCLGWGITLSRMVLSLS